MAVPRKPVAQVRSLQARRCQRGARHVTGYLSWDQAQGTPFAADNESAVAPNPQTEPEERRAGVGVGVRVGSIQVHVNLVSNRQSARVLRLPLGLEVDGDNIEQDLAEMLQSLDRLGFLGCNLERVDKLGQPAKVISVGIAVAVGRLDNMAEEYDEGDERGVEDSPVANHQLASRRHIHGRAKGHAHQCMYDMIRCSCVPSMSMQSK